MGQQRSAGGECGSAGVSAARPESGSAGVSRANKLGQWGSAGPKSGLTGSIGPKSGSVDVGGVKKWVSGGQPGLKWVSRHGQQNGGQRSQKVGQQGSAGPISESAVPENGSSGVNGAKKLGQQGRWG